MHNLQFTLHNLGISSYGIWINILKNAGVDMTTNAPIEATIKRFNELLDMIDK